MTKKKKKIAALYVYCEFLVFVRIKKKKLQN